MSLTGGKRKVNKSLKAWVAFVKKVQKEEKLSYKDAIHRAKVRKDKGEKWMVGGVAPPTERNMDNLITDTQNNDDAELPPLPPGPPTMTRRGAIGHREATSADMDADMDAEMEGGRRRRRKSRRGGMADGPVILAGGKKHRTRRGGMADSPVILAGGKRHRTRKARRSRRH